MGVFVGMTGKKRLKKALKNQAKTTSGFVTVHNTFHITRFIQAYSERCKRRGPKLQSPTNRQTTAANTHLLPSPQADVPLQVLMKNGLEAC